MGLTRGIIYVPTNMSRIRHALPCDMKETDTHCGDKEKMCYKSAYAYCCIWLHMVMKALYRLCRTMLYWMERVVVNENWKDIFLETSDTLALEIDIE